MALTSSTSIPGTLWYRDKPGLPAHFTTASVCRSASPGQCPEHVSFKSCQSSLMLKWQHKNSKNTELGTFFSPHPLKLCHLSSIFTPVLGGCTKLSRGVMKKGADPGPTLLQNTGVQIITHYSGDHWGIFPRASHSSATPVRLWTSYLRHSPASGTHLYGKLASPSHMLS